MESDKKMFIKQEYLKQYNCVQIICNKLWH